MADITLPNYLQYVNSLIDDSRLGEAAAHSRHILEQHPRFLDAYRTLGKALLEQGDYPGAVDIFHRLLGAVPADFIAHVGLAIVHKAGDRWKEALWHMERAFEVEPYNPAIRSELQDLYGRRDGLAPEQPELTQGALARFYVTGGLYQQAMLELRELLAAEPDRVDLRLLLAEALWRADDRIEAAEVCRQLLELLPDCLQANAILADILLQTGDAETAEPHLRRVQELTQVAAATLDPAEPLTRAFTLPGALPLPREVWVDRLSDEDALGMGAEAETAAWTGELNLEAAGADDDFGWLRDLQEEGEPVLPPAGGDELDWLTTEGAQVGEEFGDEVRVEPEADEAERLAEAAPDWVGSLGEDEIDWTESAGDSGEMPGWMQAEAGDLDWLDQPLVATTPDWLEEEPQAGDAGEPWLAEAAAAEEAGWLEEPAEAAGGELSWLEEIAAASETESDWPEEGGAAAPVGAADSEARAPEADLLTAWASEDATLEDETGREETGEFVEWELPGEIYEDQAEEALLEGTAMVDQGDERDERPGEEEDAGDLDWLHELEAAAETPPADQTEAPAADALPDWVEGEEGEAPALAWLGDLDDDDRPFDRMALESPASDEVAAWVRSEAGDVDTAGEDLSWLDQIAGGEAEPPEEMPTLEWPEDEEAAPEMAGDAPDMEAPEVSFAPRMDQELDWLEALSSEDSIADDTWLEELELEGDDAGTSEQGSEPKLFTEEISGLEWLDEPLAETGLAAGELAAAADEEDEGLDWLEAISAAAAEDAGEAGWLEEAGVDATGEPAFAWDEEIDAEAESPAADALEAAGEGPAAGDVGASEEPTWFDELDAEDEEAIAAEAPGAGPEETPGPAPELIVAGEFMAADDEEMSLDWLEGVDEALPATEPEPGWPAEDDSVEAAEAAPKPGEEEAELEEALTWLDEVPEGVAFEQEESVPQDLEEAMFWLDAGEVESVDSTEVPEDLDEAMAWLEQLAAQQGAPLDELPSLSAAEAAEIAGAPTEVEEVPAELELEAEETPELNLEWMEALAAVEEEPATEVGAGPAPAADDDFDVPEDLDEAMAWLESLAARQGAPLDELPSIGDEADFFEDVLADEAGDAGEAAPGFDEAPYVEEAAAPDELEEAMAWLDELAAQQSAPVAEEEAVAQYVAEPPDEVEPEPAASPEPEPAASFDPEPEPEPAALPVAEQPTPEAMVVPDVAMMYLDSLVEHGGEAAGATESGGVTASELAGEIPDDIDGMMAWLEQLANGAEPEAAEQIILDEDAGEAPEPAFALVDEAPSFIFDDEAEPAEAGLDWLTEDTVEEPAEAGLGWLAEGTLHETAEQAVEGAVDFDEVPEDPDEVMAWLERLAARQGASLDELPSVDEVSEDVETPDWLAADLAAAEAELWAAEVTEAEELATLEETAEAEDEEAGWLAEGAAVPAEIELEEEPEAEAAWLDDQTSLEWLDAVTSDEPTEGLEWLEQEEEPPVAPALEQQREADQLDFPTLAEDSESLMPDWLSLDEEAWEEEETDIASWLVAEEEMSQVSLETRPPAEVAPEPPEMGTVPDAEPSRPAQRLPAAADMDAGQLESARAALDSGDRASALNRYQNLLQAGAGVNVLIADLELATEAGVDPTLCRVLGDAYMQNGQLDRALEIYRRGLDLL